MAALAQDTPMEIAGLLRKQVPTLISNGVQLYVGSLVEDSSGYATAFAANAGFVGGFAVEGGNPGSNPVLDGYNLQSLPIPLIAPGNASTAPTGGANRVVVEKGEFTAKRVTLAVAGTLAGTQADVGKILYAVTDNIADAVTTQPGTDKPLGEITWFYPGTSSGGVAVYDILVYSVEARRGM